MSLDQYSKSLRHILFAGGLAAAAVLAGGPAVAQSQDDVGSGGTVFTRDKAAAKASAQADRLRDRARARGRIRVIVGLSTTMRSEKALSAAAAEAQRGALRGAQDRVVGRALGSATAAGVVRFDYIPYVSMFVDAGALDRVLADGEVVSVQEDAPVPPLLDDSTKIIHATDLAKLDVNGRKHVVAILDTGVASDHPMLEDKVVSEACYSTNDRPNKVRSFCNGGGEAVIGRDSAKFCDLSVPGCDHGTHVASIAAGDAGGRLKGVARSADIIAIQVFSEQRDCNGNKSCPVSFQTDQIKGLERVFKLTDDLNVDAANMSLGSGKFTAPCDTGNEALKTAIDNLRTAGVATVIASGNAGENAAIASPSCISSAIAVGNTTKDDLISESSNHSALIKLMAPGTKIEAAVPPRGYDEKTGTSMAAPHVAGAFALMRDGKPTASIDNIVAALQCSGKTVHRRDDEFGGFELAPQRPRIDVLGAYDWLRSPPNNKRDWLFKQASDEQDWSPLLGQWKVADGRYKQTPRANSWVASYVANCSRSFRATAPMTRVDGGQSFHSNSGVMFKATFNQQTKTFSGYFAAYNKCRTDQAGTCTGAQADKPGQALLYVAHNYSLATNSGSASVLCRKQAPVSVNGLNTVKVVSNGSSHSYFLNGKLVCNVTESTYPSGSLAAAAFLAADGGQAYQLEQMLTQSTDAGPDAGAPTLFDAAAMAPRAVADGESLGGSSDRTRSASR